MNDKRVFKAITMILQISISMMVPIFLCIFIGYKIDQKFGTSYWFLIFMVLGFFTSIRNVYYLTKGFYAKDKAREDAEMNYFNSLSENKEKCSMEEATFESKEEDEACEINQAFPYPNQEAKSQREAQIRKIKESIAKENRRKE